MLEEVFRTPKRRQTIDPMLVGIDFGGVGTGYEAKKLQDSNSGTCPEMTKSICSAVARWFSDANMSRDEAWMLVLSSRSPMPVARLI